MKPQTLLALIALLGASTSSLQAQGTFIYDQQSSDENVPGEAAAGIQVNEPVGQSFTPSLSTVGFIRLQLFDINPGNSLGATLYVNLRADSITGTILASTDPVSLPDSFPSPSSVGFVNFFFSIPVSVTPGTTYYFQPVVDVGGAWAIGRFIPTSNYPGGTEFLQGQPGPNDLWFREGIVAIPEPSAGVLGLLGLGVLVGAHWIKGREAAKEA